VSQVFYDWSGGMESSAMLVVDRERIRETGAVVRWADTGKHFPEMAANKAQVEERLGLEIVTVRADVSFYNWLFDVGPRGGTGIIRKGLPRCSQKMKRQPLMAHLRTFPRPWEVNLGFNVREQDRADDFSDRNEREWCRWRFPLIEAGISRDATWEICRKAGLSIVVSVYEKMGRFDCYWCGNQTPNQARKVLKHYPDLAADWMAAEKRKGHSFMPIPLAQIEKDMNDPGLFAGCSCFGGTEDVWEDEARSGGEGEGE
jgi:hypothetical protein